MDCRLATEVYFTIHWLERYNFSSRSSINKSTSVSTFILENCSNNTRNKTVRLVKSLLFSWQAAVVVITCTGIGPHLKPLLYGIKPHKYYKVDIIIMVVVVVVVVGSINYAPSVKRQIIDDDDTRCLQVQTSLQLHNKQLKNNIYTETNKQCCCCCCRCYSNLEVPSHNSKQQLDVRMSMKLPRRIETRKLSFNHKKHHSRSRSNGSLSLPFTIAPLSSTTATTATTAELPPRQCYITTCHRATQHHFHRLTPELVTDDRQLRSTTSITLSSLHGLKPPPPPPPPHLAGSGGASSILAVAQQPASVDCPAPNCHDCSSTLALINYNSNNNVAAKNSTIKSPRQLFCLLVVLVNLMLSSSLVRQVASANIVEYQDQLSHLSQRQTRYTYNELTSGQDGDLLANELNQLAANNNSDNDKLLLTAATISEQQLDLNSTTSTSSTGLLANSSSSSSSMIIAGMLELDLATLLLTIILILIILSTIIGNLFVIVSILIERNLRTVGNYLVLSLAIADLLVACLVMPMGAIYQIMDQWTLGATLCDVWTVADVFSCTASILHLLAIALDRYWAVTRVDYIRCQRSSKRIVYMIYSVWFAALIISLAPTFGWKDDNFEHRVKYEKQCLVSQDIGYQIFATCATFYVPLIFILAYYWKIFQVARKRIRHRPGNKVKISLQHPSSFSTGSSPATNGTQTTTPVKGTNNQLAHAGHRTISRSTIEINNTNDKKLLLSGGGTHTSSSQMLSTCGGGGESSLDANKQAVSNSLATLPRRGNDSSSLQAIGSVATAASPAAPVIKPIASHSPRAGSLNRLQQQQQYDGNNKKLINPIIKDNYEASESEHEKPSIIDDASFELDNPTTQKSDCDDTILIASTAADDDDTEATHQIASMNQQQRQQLPAVANIEHHSDDDNCDKSIVGLDHDDNQLTTQSIESDGDTGAPGHSNNSKLTRGNGSAKSWWLHVQSLFNSNNNNSVNGNGLITTTTTTTTGNSNNNKQLATSYRLTGGSFKQAARQQQQQDITRDAGSTESHQNTNDYSDELEEFDEDLDCRPIESSSSLGCNASTSLTEPIDKSTAAQWTTSSSNNNNNINNNKQLTTTIVVMHESMVEVGQDDKTTKTQLVNVSRSSEPPEPLESPEPFEAKKGQAHQMMTVANGQHQGNTISSLVAEECLHLDATNGNKQQQPCVVTVTQSAPPGSKQVAPVTNHHHHQQQQPTNKTATTINITTGNHLHQHQRRVSNHHHHHHHVSPSKEHHMPQPESIESKREKKAAKTLAIITGVFVICWLPFFIMAILMPLLNVKPHKYIFALLLWLGYANSMLNPIIYTIFSPDFRVAFQRLLCGKDFAANRIRRNTKRLQELRAKERKKRLSCSPSVCPSHTSSNCQQPTKLLLSCSAESPPNSTTHNHSYQTNQLNLLDSPLSKQQKSSSPTTATTTMRNNSNNNYAKPTSISIQAF